MYLYVYYHCILAHVYCDSCVYLFAYSVMHLPNLTFVALISIRDVMKSDDFHKLFWPPPINLKSDLYPFQSIVGGTASRLRFLTLFDHGSSTSSTPQLWAERSCSREYCFHGLLFVAIEAGIGYRYMNMFHCRCAREKYGQLEKLHGQIGISVKSWIVI